MRFVKAVFWTVVATPLAFVGLILSMGAVLFAWAANLAWNRIPDE